MRVNSGPQSVSSGRCLLVWFGRRGEDGREWTRREQRRGEKSAGGSAQWNSAQMERSLLLSLLALAAVVSARQLLLLLLLLSVFSTDACYAGVAVGTADRPTDHTGG